MHTHPTPWLVHALTLPVIAAALVFALNPSQANAQDAPPNIIFILADDQGYGDLSALGNPILKTPNLDRLYGQSTRFTRFYMNPVCAPSRAALMTGRYPQRTGVWSTNRAKQQMHTDELTIPELLEQKGYRSAHFAKWHLGNGYPMNPRDQGFQHSRRAAMQQKFNPRLVENGKTQQFTGYADDLYFDGAIAFIKENRERPFFVYLASWLPHDDKANDPIVPEPYLKPFKDQGLPKTTYEAYGMMTKLDENVGRLLDFLDEQGLADNTLVIFTSDNGPIFGPRASAPRFNAGLRGHKGQVFEGGIRLPAFFRWPSRFEAGRDINEPVAHIDLLPTLIDITGITPPHPNKLDGQSLLPLLLGHADTLPDRTLFFQFDRHEDIPRKNHNFAALTRQYKLVGRNQLYDLLSDPGEQMNLANQHPDIVDELRAQYDDWWTDVNRERNFEVEKPIVGTKQKRVTLFNIGNAMLKGYPLEIGAPGQYALTVRLSNRVFRPGQNYTAKIDLLGQRIEMPFTFNTKDPKLRLPPTAMPRAAGYVQVYFEGDLNTIKRAPYLDNDPGHASILIELIQ
ncbi:MAG: arylsulfatase [Planctomycetota bacterium]